MTRSPRRPPAPGLGTAGPGFDVTAYLTIWLVLLCGISAVQVLPGLGAIGSPALLLAFSTPLIWFAGWLLPRSGLSYERHPLRAALIVYLGYMLLSFAVATSRPLTSLESTGVMRALLTTFGMVGIGLLVAVGVRDQQRLETLLRRAVIGVAFISVIGILQFLTGHPLTFKIPGLVWNGEVVGVGSRSIFNRPASTTMHPIEFSVVTASLLPLAIHFSLYSGDQRRRRNLTTAAVLIAFAMPLAVSRSGIVSAVAGLAVLAGGWSWRRRLNGLLIALAAVPVLWALVPGLVGTFASLFGNSEYDPSVQARIARGPLVMALLRERPWFGLGNGTFSADEYFLLDNQVQATMLGSGLIGLAVTTLLILVGVGAGLIIARLPGIPRHAAHLGQAIGASICALSVSAFTFDAFFYRILTGLLFLLLGAAGALWRLHRGSDRLFGDGPDLELQRHRGSELRLPARPLHQNMNGGA